MYIGIIMGSNGMTRINFTGKTAQCSASIEAPEPVIRLYCKAESGFIPPNSDNQASNINRRIPCALPTDLVTQNGVVSIHHQ